MKTRFKKVEWDGANELDLQTLYEMAEDGYEFCVGNGVINGVCVPEWKRR